MELYPSPSLLVYLSFCHPFLSSISISRNPILPPTHKKNSHCTLFFFVIPLRECFRFVPLNVLLFLCTDLICPLAQIKVFNFLCYHQPLLHSGLISVLFQSSNFGVSKLKALCSASWSDSGSHPAD